MDVVVVRCCQGRKEGCQVCSLTISETHLPLGDFISATLLNATIVWNFDHSKSRECLPASSPTPALHVGSQNIFLRFDSFA